MFLFNHSRAVEVTYTTKRIDNLGGANTVLLGPSIWAKLGCNDERLSISILHIGQESEVASLKCWAILDAETSELAVPSTWLRSHHDLFQCDPIHVVSTQLPLLDEVIVSALSDKAYDAAVGSGSLLVTLLTQNSPILRQGTTHTLYHQELHHDINISDSVDPLQYHIDLTAPAQQGSVQHNHTKFIFISEERSVRVIGQEILDSPNWNYGDSDSIEINEHFLAGSYLSPSGSPHGCLAKGRQFKMVGRAGFNQREQDEPRIFLRDGDLADVGILDGDWAVVTYGSIQDGTTRSRLARVSSTDLGYPFVVSASPLFLHNLCCTRQTVPVCLLPTPFGSSQPTIPTARCITINRIASPISTDRMYQPVFLQYLRKYFERKKRLVNEGDLIAIDIDTDMALRAGESVSKSDDDAEDNEIFTLGLGSAASEHLNDTAYFMVTNVEYDVLPTKSELLVQDLYFKSASGELGCWVDPGVTRIVQMGLEHSSVPVFRARVNRGNGTGNRSSMFDDTLSAILSLTSPFGTIHSLVSATLTNDAINYDLGVSILLKGPRGVGKSTIANWVAQRLGIHFLEVNCYSAIGENNVKTEAFIQARFEKAMQCAPCVLNLRHIDALAQSTQVLEAGKDLLMVDVLKECLRRARHSWRITGFPVIVIGTTTEPHRIPVTLLALFKHDVVFEPPTEAERYEILNAILADVLISPDVSVPLLATQTAALVAGDLAYLVDHAILVSANRLVENGMYSLEATCMPLTTEDFNLALASTRASYAATIGAPSIPNVTWDDVGGLATVKSEILETIQLPLDHPELFSEGLKKRSGVLLYGPPGTGKTLLAKAVATSCALNFFSVKGPELLNMYIGESEANVRRIFQRARDAKPCVIFFDELDSVAPKRGNQGDSGGVMDRIVSQLLAELDGMSSGIACNDVFVIGATNRPDLLDPALLRPGRFDRMLYLGVSDCHEAQINILKALTRKFSLDPQLELAHLAEKCPYNLTGADFYALCADALLSAMCRKAEEIDSKIVNLNKQSNAQPLTSQQYLAEIASAEEIKVLVTTDDFEEAFDHLMPSVSQEEMEHYLVVQSKFSKQQIKDYRE